MCHSLALRFNKESESPKLIIRCNNKVPMMELERFWTDGKRCFEEKRRPIVLAKLEAMSIW